MRKMAQLTTQLNEAIMLANGISCHVAQATSGRAAEVLGVLPPLCTTRAVRSLPKMYEEKGTASLRASSCDFRSEFSGMLTSIVSCS